jgi:hypothetical protein
MDSQVWAEPGAPGLPVPTQTIILEAARREWLEEGRRAAA